MIIASRLLLSASALIIFAALPDVLNSGAASTRSALLAGAFCFAALWLWLWWRAIDSRRWAPVAVLLVTALLGFLTYLAPPGRDGLLLAALAAGAALPARPALAAVTAIALLAGALQVLHGTHPVGAAATAVNDLVVGVAGIGGRLLVMTNRELQRARDQIALLAVSEERLRLARDLHDTLGQDLTLAVMKSELVARELPPDSALRARQAEVSQSIRVALDGLRATVSGYRRLDLRSELEAAGAALATAGISLTLDDQLAGQAPPAQSDALAWALRESVTNVIRHSRARSCTVRLRAGKRELTLEVEDDGAGGQNQPAGGGLRGIAERAVALGGTFTAGPNRGAGYRVRVTVPLP